MGQKVLGRYNNYMSVAEVRVFVCISETARSIKSINMVNM